MSKLFDLSHPDMPAVAAEQTDYHADLTRDSHSSLELFRDSVEAYHATRIARTMPQSEPTPAMILGSAFHCFALEPDKFERRFVKALEIPRRSNADKETWAAFDAECQAKGLTVLSTDAWALIPAMFAGIMRNRYIRNVIEGDGICEEPVYWQDSETGRPLKCRPDKRLTNGLVFDVKTTDDISPDAWSRTVASFGYHRQGALYLDGCWAAHGADGPFVFAAVSKSPPHECAAYQLGEQSLALGRRENAETLRELAMRHDTGEWSGRWSDTVYEIEVPVWHLRKLEHAR